MSEQWKYPLLIVSAALPALGLLISAWNGRQMKQFLAEVSMLEDHHDLERFKDEAGRNMYFALVIMGLIGIAAVPVIAGFIFYGQIFLTVTLGVGATYSLSGYCLTKLEKKIQKIPTANEALERERDRIVTIWLKKALPDW